MWGVFPQLALHTWINLGHCQNNAGEVGSQVSVHCHWVQYLDVSGYAMYAVCWSKTKKSLLVPLIWTNASVLRNKHDETHWLTNCGSMRQWAVWKRQTLLAVCASSMAYCAWTRLRGVSYNKRKLWVSQTEVLKLFHDLERDRSKRKTENAQITALWECFNPQYFPKFSYPTILSICTSHFLALHLLNFAVVVSSPRFVQTSSQSVSPFQFEKRPLPHWLAMFVAPLTEPPNRWATSEMPMANGWRVIHIWLPYQNRNSGSETYRSGECVKMDINVTS